MKNPLFFSISFFGFMLFSSCSSNKLQPLTWLSPIPFQPKIQFQASPNKLINNEPQLKGIYLSCYVTAAQEGKYFSDDFASLSDIAVAYVQAKQYKQAFSIIEKWEGGDSKNRVLAKIAEQYADSRQYEQAIQVVESINLSNTIYGASTRFSVLIQIIAGMAKVKQHDRALKLAYQISDPTYRTIALARIAESYAYIGNQEKAKGLFYQSLKIIDTVRDEQIIKIVKSPRSSALSEISNSYIRLEQYEQATHVAMMITNKSYQAITLSEIGVSYALKGQLEKAKEILNKAYQIARNQPKTGRWNFSLRNKDLTKVASAYAKAGFYDQSLEVIHSIEKEREKLWFLIELSDIYINTGQQKKVDHVLEQALWIAKTMKSDDERIAALLEIVYKYQESKQLEKSDQVLLQALQTINNLTNKQELINLKAASLERIARAYMNVEQYDRAIQIAQMIEDKVQKDKLLGLIKCAYR